MKCYGPHTSGYPTISNDSRPIEIVPQSMVRMRLRAGIHRIAYDFEQDHGVIEVRGAAGQVRFIWLSGDFWVWGSFFGWSQGDEEIAKRRAHRTRLVGDLRFCSHRMRIQ